MIGGVRSIDGDGLRGGKTWHHDENKKGDRNFHAMGLRELDYGFQSWSIKTIELYGLCDLETRSFDLRQMRALTKKAGQHFAGPLRLAAS